MFPDTEAAVTSAEAAQAGRLRQIRLGTGLAWIDLFYAERRLARIDELLGSLRALPAAARSAVASGAARPAQPLGVDQAIAGLEDRRDEFVAAVAWLAELFPNPRQREKVLGYTQAFSSIGGLLTIVPNKMGAANAFALPPPFQSFDGSERLKPRYDPRNWPVRRP